MGLNGNVIVTGDASFKLGSIMMSKMELIDEASNIVSIYEQHVAKVGQEDPDYYEKLMRPIAEKRQELEVQKAKAEIQLIIEEVNRENLKKWGQELKRRFTIG